ncbi:MAG: hypothetical protein ACKVHP_09120, partial [Verrucomicrobiales bacterium]
FNLWRAWLVAGCITAFLLVAWITFVSRRGEAFRTNYELPTLISFTMAMLCPVIALVKLRASFTRQKLKNLAGQTHTPREESRTVTSLRRAFRRAKVWLLLPLLGLAVLFIPGLSKPSLVSILLDNSGSMEEPIAQAREILHTILPQFPNKSKFVITTFDRDASINSIEELMNVTAGQIDSLSGSVQAFMNPADAISHIEGVSTDQGSPICEGIWKTYLDINQQDPLQFPNRLFLIITDGKDKRLSFSDQNTQFFNMDEGFATVFPDDMVHFIDVRLEGENGGAGEGLFRAAESAGMNYNDAQDPEVYQSVLKGLLSPWTVDKDLVFITVLVFAFSAFLALFISPKRMQRVR